MAFRRSNMIIEYWRITIQNGRIAIEYWSTYHILVAKYEMLCFGKKKGNGPRPKTRQELLDTNESLLADNTSLNAQLLAALEEREKEQREFEGITSHSFSGYHRIRGVFIFIEFSRSDLFAIRSLLLSS